MRQLELGWDGPDDREGLEQSLAGYLGRPVRITLTQNRRTMVSMRVQRGTNLLEVRLHAMFASAPPGVLEALAAWLRGERSGQIAATVDGFINDHLPQQPESAAVPRRTRVQTQGAVHDLARLYAAVNAAHFDNAVDCPITWGKLPSIQRRRRSIRLGSYAPDRHLIRIHPFLDQAFVPAWFVAFIVFHEMLHAAMGIGTGPSGRRQVHPPAFKAREQAHPDYARAEAWLADPKNLRRLLGPWAHGAHARLD